MPKAVEDLIPGNTRSQRGGHTGFQYELKCKHAGACLKISFLHCISISILLFTSTQGHASLNLS